MENLKSEKNSFECSSAETDLGTLVKFVAQNRFSTQSVYSYTEKNQGIIALNDYSDDGLYTLKYLTVDKFGKIVSIQTESEGTIPHLFTAPDNSLWVSLTSNKADNSREVVLPMKKRERIKELITTKRFPTDTILQEGKNLRTVLHKYNWYDNKKPSKICVFNFDSKKLYCDRNVFKIELPAVRKALMNDEGIHLISDVDPVLHRLINTEGELLNKREIKFKHGTTVFPLHLSFEGLSSFIAINGRELLYLAVDSKKNKVTAKNKLLKLPSKFELSDIPLLKKINDTTYVMRFTTKENGDGWCIIHNGKLLDAYLTSTEFDGYQSLIHKQNQLQLDFARPTIFGIIAFNSTDYGITFASLKKRNEGYLFIGKITE